MSEQVRKEFEKWAKEDGIDLELVVTPHGSYYADEEARAAWDGWQASRRSLVVKLPVLFVDGVDAAEYRDCVLESLNNAGASYKEIPINNEVSNDGK
jgi:hypothetical protein